MPTRSAGDARADETIRRVVEAFDGAFPDRVRGCHVLGSYADGSFTATSDLDLVVLFRDAFLEGEKARAAGLAASLQGGSRLQLDIEPIAEGEAGPIVAVSLLDSALTVAGEDVRLPRPPIDEYTWALVEDACLLMRRLRPKAEPVAYPLGYPDAEAAFYGYDVKLLRTPAGEIVRSSKALAMITGWTASAILALRSDCYVPTKDACLRLYRERIGDEWGGVLEDVRRRCRDQRSYLLPADAAGRAELRVLCERVLAFENHALALFREYLVPLLASDDPRRQLRAAALLTQVVFPDADTERALAALAESGATDDVRRAASDALTAIAAARAS